MEFESPDVERDFPGLYASESGKRSNESDFSDEAHERISKKDLLIGKRKDKKDSKKDRGYATLEGESSPEEDTDIKSPSKLKKSKPFKFPSKKEKREKSREKDVKDKESDKDKKKSDDKEKEKKKETKVKLKLKERKKSKHGDDIAEVDDLPIFGVPLSIAVERSKCHDGVDIPLVVRDCIDHIQQTGLTAENLYKISGIKSRVQQVRRLYNQRESVRMSDYDLPVATSLLKTFLRELPEPLLTTDLLLKFEEAGALRDVSTRGVQFRALVDRLPSCNRTLLAWLLKHFDSISDHEKQNKMNAQSIATAMSPVLQTSERLLTALLCHSSAIFPDTRLTRYVPPLSCGALPDSIIGILVELRKQESLLGQIHKEMQQGRVSKQREEQLWEVQRIITQLKRKLRTLERGAGQRSLDETDNSQRSGEDDLNLSLQKAPTTPNSYHHPPSALTNSSVQPTVTIQQQPGVIINSSVQLPLPVTNNLVAHPSISSLPQPVICNNVVQPPVQLTVQPPVHPPVQLAVQAPVQLAVQPPVQLAVQAPLQLAVQPPVQLAVQPPVQLVQPSVQAVQPPILSSCALQPSLPSSKLQPTLTNNVVHPVIIARQNSCTTYPTTHTIHMLPPIPMMNDIKHMTSESMEVEEIYKEAEKKQKAVVETEELLEAAKRLRTKIDKERQEIETLRTRIIQLGGTPQYRLHFAEGSDECCGLDEKGLREKKQELREETKRLQKQKKLLLASICAEYDNCIDLRVQIKLLRKNH